MIAEGAGNDFVDNFGSRETVFGSENRDLLVGAAKSQFAVDEALEAREIRIYIRADVVGRNRGRHDGGHSLFKGDAGLGRFRRAAAPVTPLVAGAQHFFVSPDLLDEFIKGSLDGSSRAGCFFLSSELAGV